MHALNGPVAAINLQYALRRSLLRRATGDPQRDLQCVLTGFLVDAFTFYAESLNHSGGLSGQCRAHAGHAKPGGVPDDWRIGKNEFRSLIERHGRLFT